MATSGGGSSSSYDIETNWRVAAGNLKSNVVFESSSEDYSPVDSSSLDSVNGAAKNVLLKPSETDSGPCEITIRLLQKHEIRQIYVRSTARVYEVYYAQSSQSDSEYLCTVRCSIAERDEEVLRAFDIEESTESYENSSAELKEEKLSAEGNSGTSEDEWVEVKVLDSSLDHRINSLSNKKTAIMGKVVQDLYEATAEINDLDPGISVTLRFLSLQNKSCVCIDEVYIFADPVSAIDSENQSQDVKGSAGRSLMAMLVPTLLQLSKSGMSKTKGQQASSDLGKGNEIESQSKATDLTDLTNHQDEKGSGDRECGKLQRVDGSMTVPTENHLRHKILDGEKSDNTLDKIDPPYGRIEKVLEQLVSRVGRIEEVCLRFEENMLKPLNSMEMRIQKVEQQLDVLVNNSRNSGLPHCTRIVAPSFSCTSNCSSFHDEGRDYQPWRAPEPEKEMTSGDLSNASNGVSRSANVPHLFPSLVVTAPDFTCEIDPDDEGLKLLKISPVETKKKSLIDDVLASSLSGFLSSSTGDLLDYKKAPSSSHDTSEVIGDKLPTENIEVLASGVEPTNNINAKKEPSRYTQVLTVMAPEFTSEENAGEELLNYDKVACVALPEISSEISQSSNNVTLEGNGNGCRKVTADLPDMNRDTLASNQASIPSNVNSPIFPESNSIISDDLVLGVAVTEGHFSERSNTCRSVVSNLDNKGEEAEGSISIDVCHTIRGSDQREPLTSLFPEINDEFEWFLGDKRDGSPISTGTVGGGTGYIAAEVPDREILQKLSESSSASLVDFGIPILDVKFTPYENSRTGLPLEALLDDAIDLNFEGDPPHENGAGDACAQENFIDINEEDETGNSLTGKSLEALLDHAVDLNVEADPRENGAGDAYAQETNFIDISEEDETGNSLTGKSLVRGGLDVYDTTLGSMKESVVDDSYSTREQDTVVSLI